MSILGRIRDRLTGVLGYDCNGKPLRKGDLVEPRSDIPYELMVDEGLCICTVQRLASDVERLRFDFPPGALILTNGEGCELIAKHSRFYVKIDDEQGQASWESVTSITGWTPQVVEEEQLA